MVFLEQQLLWHLLLKEEKEAVYKLRRYYGRPHELYQLRRACKRLADMTTDRLEELKEKG